MRLSDLASVGKSHERERTDPDYRSAHERTRFSDDVAIRVLRYLRR